MTRWLADGAASVSAVPRVDASRWARPKAGVAGRRDVRSAGRVVWAIEGAWPEHSVRRPLRGRARPLTIELHAPARRALSSGQ